jgi:hypothetical protein
MRISFMLFADAANSSVDGKVNMLGGGIRVVTVPALPAVISGALVASVHATLEEAGSYEVALSLVDPHGTERAVVSGRSDFDPTGGDPRVPSGIGITAPVIQPVIDAGVYLFRLRVGDLLEEYPFVVQTSASPPADEPKAVARQATGRQSSRKLPQTPAVARAGRPKPRSSSTRGARV